MDKLSPTLSQDELMQNIDAMKGKLPDADIQSYVNNYKSDGKGGYVLGAGAPTTAPAPDNSPGAQWHKIIDAVDNNPVSRGLTSLAALPVQLGVKAVNAVAGTHYPDPYAGGIGGNGGDIPSVNVTSSDQPAGKFAEEELGNAATVGSLFIPTGAAGEAAGVGLKALGLSPGLAGAAGRIAASTATGYATDVAKHLQEKDIAGDVLKPGVGTALGAGISTIGELASGVVNKLASNTGVARVTQQKDNLRTLQNAFNDTSTKTTDPITTLGQNGLVKEIKVNDGKINVDGLTNPQGTGRLDDLIEQQKQAGTQAVAGMTGGVPIDSFKNAVIDSIKSNPMVKASGKVQNNIKEITRMFDDYRESYGDVIPYKDVDSIRVAMNKVWNPDTWDAEKAVGNASRSLLYNADVQGTQMPGSTVMNPVGVNSKGASSALQSAMQNEQELINAKEFVEKLRGTAVKGGRLGKYLADLGAGLVGGLAGSAAGPFGTAIGSTVGTGIANKMVNSYQTNFFNSLSGRAGAAMKSFGSVVGPAVSQGSKLGAFLPRSNSAKGTQ